MFDVDRFKRVNDTYGHLVGDDTLVHLTKLVTADKRAKDDLYRYGGEEFFLLLPNTNLKGAVKLAHRVQQAVRNESFPIIKHLTISMGVVEYHDGETIDDIIKRVDDLLNDAKHAGRNAVKY